MTSSSFFILMTSVPTYENILPLEQDFNSQVLPTVPCLWLRAMGRYAVAKQHGRVATHEKLMTLGETS